MYKVQKIWIGTNTPHQAEVGDVWVDDCGPRKAVIKERVADDRRWRKVGKVRLDSEVYNTHLLKLGEKWGRLGDDD